MEQKTQLSMRERFRKNLSDALERSGLTQAQLADRLAKKAARDANLKALRDNGFRF